MPARFLLAAGAVLYLAADAEAGLLKIGETGEAGQICLDFDRAVTSGNSGQYEARGLNQGGPLGGICSNTWAIRGLSDGSTYTSGGTLFSGTYPDPVESPDAGGTNRTTPSDFTRGTSAGAGDTLGGMYGYDVSSASGETFENTGVDRAFGIRTGDGDFGDGRAGEIYLRFQNDTQTDPIENWEVSYDVYTLNDTVRGGTLEFAYAQLTSDKQKDPTLSDTGDPLTYTVAGGAVTLADAADALGWVKTSRTLRFAASVARTEILQLRWRLGAVTGGTAGDLGDAFAIDNLKITANPESINAVPEPGAVILFGLCGLAGAAGARRRKRVEK